MELLFLLAFTINVSVTVMQQCQNATMDAEVTNGAIANVTQTGMSAPPGVHLENKSVQYCLIDIPTVKSVEKQDVGRKLFQIV
jgi:hypothetical protein